MNNFTDKLNNILKRYAKSSESDLEIFNQYASELINELDENLICKFIIFLGENEELNSYFLRFKSWEIFEKIVHLISKVQWNDEEKIFLMFSFIDSISRYARPKEFRIMILEQLVSNDFKEVLSTSLLLYCLQTIYNVGNYYFYFEKDLQVIYNKFYTILKSSKEKNEPIEAQLPYYNLICSFSLNQFKKSTDRLSYVKIPESKQLDAPFDLIFFEEKHKSSYIGFCFSILQLTALFLPANCNERQSYVDLISGLIIKSSAYDLRIILHFMHDRRAFLKDSFSNTIKNNQIKRLLAAPSNTNELKNHQAYSDLPHSIDFYIKIVSKNSRHHISPYDVIPWALVNDKVINSIKRSENKSSEDQDDIHLFSIIGLSLFVHHYALKILDASCTYPTLYSHGFIFEMCYPSLFVLLSSNLTVREGLELACALFCTFKRTEKKEYFSNFFVLNSSHYLTGSSDLDKISNILKDYLSISYDIDRFPKRSTQLLTSEKFCLQIILSINFDVLSLSQWFINAIATCPDQTLRSKGFYAFKEFLFTLEERSLFYLLKTLFEECPYQNIRGLIVDIVKEYTVNVSSEKGFKRLAPNLNEGDSGFEYQDEPTFQNFKLKDINLSEIFDIKSKSVHLDVDALVSEFEIAGYSKYYEYKDSWMPIEDIFKCFPLMNSEISVFKSIYMLDLFVIYPLLASLKYSPEEILDKVDSISASINLLQFLSKRFCSALESNGDQDWYFQSFIAFSLEKYLMSPDKSQLGSPGILISKLVKDFFLLYQKIKVLSDLIHYMVHEESSPLSSEKPKSHSQILSLQGISPIEKLRFEILLSNCDDSLKQLKEICEFFLERISLDS